MTTNIVKPVAHEKPLDKYYGSIKDDSFTAPKEIPASLDVPRKGFDDPKS